MQLGLELGQKFGPHPMVEVRGNDTALWQDAPHSSMVLSLSLFSILSFILCFPLLLSSPIPYTFILPNISVQSLSRVWLFATPWTAACQASLSITNSQSLLRLMSIELMMPSNHLILCHPLLLLPSIFPNIRVFSNESVLRLRWPSIGVSAIAVNLNFLHTILTVVLFSPTFPKPVALSLAPFCQSTLAQLDEGKMGTTAPWTIL